MQNKKKNLFIEWGLTTLIFSIPYFSGAFLYGVLDWDSIFHIPILILSLVIFFVLIKTHSKKFRSVKNDKNE